MVGGEGQDTGRNGGEDNAADALVLAAEERAVDVRVCGVEACEFGGLDAGFYSVEGVD